MVKQENAYVVQMYLTGWRICRSFSYLLYITLNKHFSLALFKCNFKPKTEIGYCELFLYRARNLNIYFFEYIYVSI